MIISNKYIIKKNKTNTILINKHDTSEIYLFDNVAKLIIDNIEKEDKKVISLIQQKYNVDIKTATNDYKSFVKSLNDLTNAKKEVVKASKIDDLLNAKSIKECTIEITDICPFNCDHCYLPKTNHSYMNYDKFKYIVDELCSLNVNHILLTGGDPLFNPDFNKMYLYLKEKGLFVYINTTLYHLSDSIVKLFKKYKPDGIEISIYGYNNETYNDFTHSLNSYEKVISNIKKLKELNINVKLKTILTKKNYFYIKEIKELAKSLNLPFRYDYILFPKLNEFGKKNSECVTTDQIIEVIRQDNEDSEYFKNAVKNIKKIKENYKEKSTVFQCSLGKDRIFIDMLGNIKLCMVTPYKININDMSIVEAINLLNKEVNKLKLKKEDRCYNCYKKKLCRYCPGRFYMETLSYTIPPEFYCELANKLIKEFDK